MHGKISLVLVENDLSKIIAKNEDVFNDVFNISWAKQLLESLNQSRRITMHGGMLDEDDIVRIGVWIRDWNRQVGI